MAAAAQKGTDAAAARCDNGRDAADGATGVRDVQRPTLSAAGAAGADEARVR